MKLSFASALDLLSKSEDQVKNEENQLFIDEVDSAYRQAMLKNKRAIASLKSDLSKKEVWSDPAIAVQKVQEIAELTEGLRVLEELHGQLFPE